MKKKLSLVLAAVLVAVMFVSVLPFGAFAALPEEAEVRIGDKLVSFELALMLINGSEEDVTMTLLKDIKYDAQIKLFNIMKKADGSDVHVTIDGNGHTLSGNAGNWLQPGGGGGKDKTATITIKDINLNYSGAGSAIHIYSGGNYVFENVNLDCTAPMAWSAINMNNYGNGPDNVMYIDMYNVNVKTLPYGNKSGDSSIFRTGNDQNPITNSPYSEIYLENCYFAAVGEIPNDEATIKDSTMGLHFTSPNSRMEAVNTTFLSQNEACLYVASAASYKTHGDPDAEGNTPIKLGKFTDCTFDSLNETDSLVAKVEMKRPEWFEWVETGKIPDTTGKAAVVYDDTGAGTAYDTLPAAVEAANASISDTMIVLCADADLGSSDIILKNNAKKAIILDGNNHKITATAGNAIKVGADGDTDALVYIKNLNIDYTGVGSIIQIYAGGRVELYNVKIQSNGKLNWCAVNALNKAGTTLDLNIDDCVITGADNGNNANAGLVRTGNNGNFVNLTIKGSTIIAQAGAAAADKPITALNVTSAFASVIIDDCLLMATNNSAIIVLNDLAAKVQISNSYIANESETVEVLSNDELFTIDPLTVTLEGGPKPADTTPDVTTPEPDVDVTTPEPDVDVTTPDAGADVTTPDAGEQTPAQTTAKPEAPKGGACGGIAIAAQLAALVLAAAAVMIIKKK